MTNASSIKEVPCFKCLLEVKLSPDLMWNQNKRSPTKNYGKKMVASLNHSRMYLACYFFTSARSNEIIQVPDLGWSYPIVIVQPQLSSTLQHIFHRWVVISFEILTSLSLPSRQMLGWTIFLGFPRHSRLETARKGTLNKLIISAVIFET